MKVHRLAQCYRCRRIFEARGDQRYCPDCAEDLRSRQSRVWQSWRPFALVVGGIVAILLLQGTSPLVALLSAAALAAWYVYVQG